MKKDTTATTQNDSSMASRRRFLAASASVAAMAGAAQRSRGAEQAPAGPPASASVKDPQALAARFGKFLRVTDVADGLDAVGRADLTLLDREIRRCGWE